jgi:hypothetical protein
VALAALAPAAQGAAFLPGAETELGADATSTSLPAPEEPLRGSGIQWTLAPWRHSGTLALNLRWLRTEDGRRSQQGLLVGDIDFASHVWQPWFIQLRFGLGLAAASGHGDALGPGSQSATLLGRASLLVFPASRFPFELRADLSDSRAGGVNLGGDYRTRRVSLSQGYRPALSSDSYQLQMDRSVLDDGVALDTLTTLTASGVRQLGPHTVELGLSRSEHSRSDNEEHTVLSAASARHSFDPASSLHLETLASWNEVRLGGALADAGSDVRQLASYATWRPRAAGFAGGNAPLVAGTARWIEARALGAGHGPRVQAFNATLGASQDLSPEWRANLSGSATRRLAADGADDSSSGVQGALSWSRTAEPAAGWRYAPGATLNAGFIREPEGLVRERVGLQLSHTATRELALSEHQMLVLGLSQSVAALRESGDAPLARALSHGASLSWHAVDDTGSQGFGGLSYNDSLTRGASRGRFQLVNLQLSQRAQLGRFSSWSANFTAQATRNRASEIDVFSGQQRELGEGWQRFYSGTVSLENQRTFGVPRLYHSLLLGANSQALERRALGDIDAQRERVTASLESRLDYAIGRLDTRLSARAARVDGRRVAGVQARVQRRF